MPEDFTTPVGIRLEAPGITETWSLTVNEDGDFVLRSNSPVGEGQPRLIIDDDSGRVSVGTTDDPAELRVTNRVRVADDNGTIRIRLTASGQRLEILNSAGEIIGMVGGGGNIRAGTNGEDGNLFLYRSSETNIFSNGDATIRASASSGDLTLGGNGVNGDVFLRDAEGTNRVRLSSAGQRLEVMNDDGEIIGLMGGGGNVRAGTNGVNGDLFLYRSESTNIFDVGEASVRLNASNANMVLGGSNVDGDIFVRDAAGTNRVRLSAFGQRLEVMNRQGEIIGMIGGAGNIRAGSNGEGGNLFLYPSTATDIFDNNEATIRLDGNSGDIVLQNADFAEDFDIAAGDHDEAEPGSVMVLREDGALERCSQAYDSRLVGVISGAGGYRPGIVMDKQSHAGKRRPVALVGKVYCRVDARHGSIKPGDLLTSSPTEGCGMKASDRERAFGAVLGKALASLQDGVGLIPILVRMQ